MDSEVAKAPVPIERVANQLRWLRAALPPVGGRAAMERDPALMMRYDALLLTAAAMLEVPVPEPGTVVCPDRAPASGSYYDPATRRLVEQALARAGLDVRAAQS